VSGAALGGRDAAAEARFQAGRDAWMRNDLAGAEPALREALALAPGNRAIRFALGAVLLKSGGLAEGYPLYAGSRPAERMAPGLPLPRWQGGAVAGKRVLVWSEDGFGDQILYARYARQLVEQGARVRWACPPQLDRLLGRLGVETLPSDRPFELRDIDLYIPTGQLFTVGGYALSGDPYLPFPRVAAPAGRVGVMASAGADHSDGPARSLPPDLASELRSLPGAVDLDPQATGATDFVDTAEIIAGLERVITVDTAVAHLAGAMGKPVSILLPYVADWRWFTDPSRSPFYASATLYRQPSPGAWREPFERALAA
jgi:hypothetical protein